LRTLRVVLVVNTFASSVTARNTVMVHRELSRRHEVTLVETSRRGHAIRFARDAARRGLDAVIAFGGDGTLNEVATGLARTDSALGVIPGGSTNVFARTLGLPNDPVTAARLVAAGLDDAAFDPIGLGRVNGRYFCFHTGIGFDAAVVERVERSGSMKRWLGHPLFINAAVTTWLRSYRRHPPIFEVSGSRGGTGAAGPAHGCFCVVLNTDPYTYLGNRPLSVSRDAALDRGLVAVLFTDLSAPALMRTVCDAIRGTGLRGGSHLQQWTDLERLEIVAAAPVPYQVDGDHLGQTEHLLFDHVPEAVRLLRPADHSRASTARAIAG
jgi:diacylglycerol kinase family enzyme